MSWTISMSWAPSQTSLRSCGHGILVNDGVEFLVYQSEVGRRETRSEEATLSLIRFAR
jgi:hypothetical protein